VLSCVLPGYEYDLKIINWRSWMYRRLGRRGHEGYGGQGETKKGMTKEVRRTKEVYL
jgi:hypothetical protein